MAYNQLELYNKFVGSPRFHQKNLMVRQLSYLHVVLIAFRTGTEPPATPEVLELNEVLPSPVSQSPPT